MKNLMIYAFSALVSNPIVFNNISEENLTIKSISKKKTSYIQGVSFMSFHTYIYH